MNKLNILILFICLFSIIGLESYALHQGINGKGLALAIGCVFGIAGWFFKGLKQKKDNGRFF